MAITKAYESYEDQVLDLIEFNNHRHKTKIEEFNEIKFYREMFGKKQGQRTDLQHKPSFVGNTREHIASALDMSSTNIHKIEFIHRIDPELLKTIDKGDSTIHSAYKEAQKIAKANESLNGEMMIFPKKKKHTKPSFEESESLVELSAEYIVELINLLNAANAKFCKCPQCSTILDTVELIKSQRYADKHN